MNTLITIGINQDLLNDIVSFSVENALFKERSAELSIGQLKNTETQGVSSSLRIEGSHIKDYELERIVNGLKVSTLSQKEALEARGLERAYSYIEKSYDEIEISESSIKGLHTMMMGSPSSYRTKEKPKQNIMENEPEVENEMPYRINTSIKRLIEDYNRHSREDNYLALSLSFMLSFLSINPFEEGNGRLSRLLLRLMLLKGGYPVIRALPFERRMEEERKAYLLSLKRSQERKNAEPFMSFMMRLLRKECDKLMLRLSPKGADERALLSPIERDIMSLIEDRGSIYTAEIVSSLPEYQPPTLKKALIRLRDQGRIKMNGKGRGTYYSPSGPNRNDLRSSSFPS